MQNSHSEKESFLEFWRVFSFKDFVIVTVNLLIIDAGCPPPSYEPGNAERADYNATRKL